MHGLEMAAKSLGNFANIWLGGWKNTSDEIVWSEGCRAKFSKLVLFVTANRSEGLLLQPKDGQWIAKSRDQHYHFVCQVQESLKSVYTSYQVLFYFRNGKTFCQDAVRCLHVTIHFNISERANFYKNNFYTRKVFGVNCMLESLCMTIS